MPYYQKRPVVVEAVQWTGANITEMKEFAGESFRCWITGAEIHDQLHGVWIPLTANIWVIKGVKGEFYPCVNVVFEETYREVRTAEGNK